MSIRATLSVEYRMHEAGDNGLSDRAQVLDCFSDELSVEANIRTTFFLVFSGTWQRDDARDR